MFTDPYISPSNQSHAPVEFEGENGNNTCDNYVLDRPLLLVDSHRIHREDVGPSGFKIVERYYP